MTFEEHKIAYWKAVDWTRPRSEIMAETGCSIGCIIQWYSRVFGGTAPRVIKSTETLEALDWSKSDSQLARETHISSGSIRSYLAQALRSESVWIVCDKCLSEMPDVKLEDMQLEEPGRPRHAPRKKE